MRRIGTFLALAAANAAAVPASAQFDAYSSGAGSMAAALTLPAALNPCPGGRCNALRGSSGGSAGALRSGGARSGAQAFRPVANGALSAGTYQPTAALSKAALAGYIQRVRRTNPAAADELAREFAKHDYRPVYQNIVGQAGFRADSVSDAMAAYMMMAWLIANGGTREPSRAEATGLRRQFAARVAGDPTVLANKAKLGEELKLLLVTLNAGFQSAQREGSQRRYADNVNAVMQKQYGINLRALRLSPQGFVDA